MMPIAMITGGIFYKYTGQLSFCTPYLIVIMLFITYCNVSLRDIRISPLHIWLLLIQLFGSVAVYMLLLPMHPVLAQGAMICILAPTATSAPVITNMLGGNVASLTTYSLLSNISVSFVAPIVFTLIGGVETISFWQSLSMIFQKIFLLLLFPFIMAWLLGKLLPRVHDSVKKAQSLSFYLWGLALTIITGRTVGFIVEQQTPMYIIEISIALASLIVCVGQFLIGRRIGRSYDDTIAGGQGLGQKNTILAIWMAQNYLNPIASVGPGAYVLWQNLVNSYQVWKKRRTL